MPNTPVPAAAPGLPKPLPPIPLWLDIVALLGMAFMVGTAWFGAIFLFFGAGL